MRRRAVSRVLLALVMLCATAMFAVTPVSVNPASLSFPETTVGLGASGQKVTFTNNSGTDVTLTPTTSGSFAIWENYCTGTLASGATCVMIIGYVPQAAGAETGSLDVAYTGGVAPLTVALSGTGLGKIQLTTEALTFAATNVGSGTSAQRVGVLNRTGSDITITPTITGSFRMSTNGCTGTLAPNSGCYVFVNYQATATGQQTGQLTVTPSTGTPAMVSLTGTGIGDIQMSTTGLIFPSTSLGGGTSSQRVGILNRTGTGITITPALAGSFRISANSCTGTIVPNNGCYIFVQYRATASGAQFGSLTVTPTGGGTAKTVRLFGSSGLTGCDGTEWFCDDFQTGSTDNWDLTPNVQGSVPGVFSIIDDPTPGGAGNKTVMYTAGNNSATPASGYGVIALIKDAIWNALPINKTNSDYYIEARMAPLYNSTTGNKQMYMIGRYQNAANWYLGGINAQTASTSTQVEAGYNLAGTITRGSQSKIPMYVPISTDPLSAAQWHTVRFEMKGIQLTIYIDNQMMTGSKILTDTRFANGKFGLFTANKSFFIDDIRVGDPTVKPYQLYYSSASTALVAGTYTAEVGDTPLSLTVTSLKPDLTSDTFTVSSSNTAVATVSVVGDPVNGATVNVNPVGVGTAIITLTSVGNPKVTRTITAKVNTSFTMPTVTYPSFENNAYPAPTATGAYIDGKLKLTFDAPPTLNTSAGSIRIYKTSDNSLADIIRMVNDTDSIGSNYSSNGRGLYDIPVWVSGNDMVIAPHQSKLAYNTSYYVAISSDAVTSGTLNGQAFAGIGLNGVGGQPVWTFTTKSAPSVGLSTLTVSASGLALDGVTPADFKSVQGALNYIMLNSTASPTINVLDGTYQELLFLRGINNVTIHGQSRAGTIIQYNNWEGLNSGSGGSSAGAPTSGGGRSVFLVENADYLTLDNLTLKNTHLRSYNAAANAQAETIYYNVDTGHLIAKNADFWSEQDTLQLKGYNWFYNTLVAGNVDFIWGNNRTTLFENSEIRMIGDSASNSSAYFNVQARTYAGERGFFFVNSTITTGLGPTGTSIPANGGYLARAATGTWVDNVFYINCRMDTHINALGWAANVSGNPLPNPSTATLDSGWREWGSMDLTGTPLDVSGRSSASSHAFDPTGSYLDSRDPDLSGAYPYSRALIFSNIGWNPMP